MDENYEGRLESRPSLTEDQSHPNHWRNRPADLKASAGALWHAMGSQDTADWHCYSEVWQLYADLFESYR